MITKIYLFIAKGKLLQLNWLYKLILLVKIIVTDQTLIFLPVLLNVCQEKTIDFFSINNQGAFQIGIKFVLWRIKIANFCQSKCNQYNRLVCVTKEYSSVKIQPHHHILLLSQERPKTIYEHCLRLYVLDWTQSNLFSISYDLNFYNIG